MTYFSQLRRSLTRLPWLGSRVQRLAQPVRKLAFHDGAYRNLAATGPHLPGCNLVGFARGELGIGQHLRGVVQAFEAAGVDSSLVNHNRTLHRQEDHSLEQQLVVAERDGADRHRANLFCLNADGILDLYDRRRELFAERYNIGYGFWELSDFPDAWLPVMNVLDEIWAPSRYVQQVMSEKASVPVVHMPLTVDVAPSRGEQNVEQDSERYTRRDFGLADDQTVFLFTFDFSSRVRRKNPQGVIEAFRRAFPAERRDVALVLKSKTVDSVPEQVEDARTVAEIARRDRRVRLINETWPRRKVLDLIACCDVYVSLHRAEGFGLGMAEAMQFGKPVIATDYSGNTDFTHPDNACLVGFELIDVEPGENYDLEGSSVWAEPDIDEAADHMRFLARDREARRRLGDRGRRYIEELHSPRTIGERYRQRLERIGLL